MNMIKVPEQYNIFKNVSFFTLDMRNNNNKTTFEHQEFKLMIFVVKKMLTFYLLEFLINCTLNLRLLISS